MKYAAGLTVYLISSGAGFAYFGFVEISYAIIEAVLLAIVNGIFKKKDKE